MSDKKNVFLFWPAMPSRERLLPKIEELLYPKDGSRPFIGEGGLVEKFEEECSKKFGFDYALFTNSGTSALDLSLLGAGVKSGDEVITTPLTCTATNLPIIGRQAKPVFADVQYETGNIDPKDIAKKVTDKTKAIMIVSWGGYPCEMDVTPVVCQCLRQFIEDSQSVLPHDFDDGIEIGILIVDLHLRLNPWNNLSEGPVRFLLMREQFF